MVSCFIIYLVNTYKLIIFIALLLLCYKVKKKKKKYSALFLRESSANLRFKSKFNCAQV